MPSRLKPLHPVPTLFYSVDINGRYLSHWSSHTRIFKVVIVHSTIAQRFYYLMSEKYCQNVGYHFKLLRAVASSFKLLCPVASGSARFETAPSPSCFLSPCDYALGGAEKMVTARMVKVFMTWIGYGGGKRVCILNANKYKKNSGK